MSESLDPERLIAACNRAAASLLDRRTPAGHWCGELSSSALSTATAVTALSLVQRHREVGHSREYDRVLNAGLAWLATHQNPDGGWGDTVRSFSNISTTTLCWAAFGAVGRDDAYPAVLQAAERWLTQRAGGVQPDQLAPAIIARYGKDRTFSVPILTLCALAGRLGRGREAWRHVIPLPFELAALPHQFFAALRLPVVSYALPALIAIGLARHHHRPSANPVVRGIRNATRERTLKVLEAIQPGNGGFLEATPLTSFVTMSLAGSGLAGHPVARRGTEFLLQSQQPDGSWPIDTNLATWVTTMSVNALAASELTGMNRAQPGPELRDDGAEAIRQWLLQQQYRVVHPYTHAAPGGWAWTDLPGGVPDADDTSGALLALRQLGSVTEDTKSAACAGLEWLLNLQNRDGGIPTFCRGWGALPFDRSSADITAHAIRAWLAWRDDVPASLRARLFKALPRGLNFLADVQRPDGSWLPLWFGNQHMPDDENPTYGTARVASALCEATQSGISAGPDGRLRRSLQRVREAEAKAELWLVCSQRKDGSWGGGREGVSSVEETALATEAVAMLAGRTSPASPNRLRSQLAALSGARWLTERVESGDWLEPSPIGFYFAKLWYYERLYPVIFTVSALHRAAALVNRASQPATLM